MQEAKATNITVHNKKCIGCQKFKSDVMITVQSEPMTFYDYFLSDEQAEALIIRLQEVLEQNKEPIRDYEKIQN